MKRMYNIEESVSVQHELRPGASVTAGWFHRTFKNLRRRDNVLQTFGDYTPFTLFSPIDGSAITYYNVSRAKLSAVSTVDTNGSSDRKMWFNGLEYNFSARLTHGITIFGGGMSERTIAQLCDETWNPNLLPTATRRRATCRGGRSSRSPARCRCATASGELLVERCPATGSGRRRSLPRTASRGPTVSRQRCRWPTLNGQGAPSG
jgi:hypothetical protein